MVTAGGVLMTTADGTQMITGTRIGRFGAELDAWGLLAQAWARKMSARGNESTSNGREVGQQTVVFRIRYRASLSMNDRIVYDGHAYDIVDVTEIERRKLQDITCTLYSNTRPTGNSES